MCVCACECVCVYVCVDYKLISLTIPPIKYNSTSLTVNMTEQHLFGCSVSRRCLNRASGVLEPRFITYLHCGHDYKGTKVMVHHILPLWTWL